MPFGSQTLAVAADLSVVVRDVHTGWSLEKSAACTGWQHVKKTFSI